MATWVVTARPPTGHRGPMPWHILVGSAQVVRKNLRRSDLHPGIAGASTGKLPGTKRSNGLQSRRLRPASPLECAFVNAGLPQTIRTAHGRIHHFLRAPPRHLPVFHEVLRQGPLRRSRQRLVACSERHPARLQCCTPVGAAQNQRTRGLSKRTALHVSCG